MNGHRVRVEMRLGPRATGSSVQIGRHSDGMGEAFRIVGIGQSAAIRAQDLGYGPPPEACDRRPTSQGFGDDETERLLPARSDDCHPRLSDTSSDPGMVQMPDIKDAGTETGLDLVVPVCRIASRSRERKEQSGEAGGIDG